MVLEIQKINEGYYGTFNTERKNWINTRNRPIDSIELKGDSLFIKVTQGNDYSWMLKLKHNESNNTYEGFSYFGTEVNEPVLLSREPGKWDLEKKAFEKKTYDKQDTLRGSITPERAWWDLAHYELDFEVDIEERSLKGSNTISYTVLEAHDVMQIDLQPPMVISKAVQHGEELNVRQDGNAWFIQMNDTQEIGASNEVVVFYNGVPRDDPNPPWGGGLSWKEDENGKPLVFTACQAEGSSLWWPCKDHMYDEPDEGMVIKVTVPENLTAVANGRHTDTEKNKNGTTTYEWTVVNPINNYGVALNVAEYVHFSDPYQGLKGKLDCDYYVLPQDLEKAKVQFKQVHLMLEAFEYWFGPYPFYEDGYKLVEGVGMEHQSSVGYSGEYINGAHGNDFSNSGWGLKFDYLIIHESGHEWFANSITYKDIADMWVHEGFTTYSEALYVEYHFGKEAGQEYVIGINHGIRNDRPMIGNYDINDKEYTGDIYPKGAALLHTLRQVIDDDEQWRSILTGLNTEFYHKTVTSGDVEQYIAEKAGMDLSAFFDQYLRTTKVPTLEYYYKEDLLAYRWINAVPGFDMPVKVFIEGEEHWLHPNTIWTQDFGIKTNARLIFDPNFYMASFRNMKD